MKKVISLVMLLLVCYWSECGYMSKSEAANWVKIFEVDGENGYEVCIDTDSFKYNARDNIIQSWQKYYLKNENSDLMTYSYFNLNDDSAANKAIVKYVNGKNEGDVTNPYLEYRPIVPGSVEDEVYSVLKYIKKVQESNVDWEFNDRYYSEPSPIGSSNWKIDEATGLVYDEKTKYEFAGTTTCWLGKPPFIVCYQSDLKKGKGAILAAKLVSGEKTIVDLHFPVLIWIVEGSADSFEKRLFDEQMETILKCNI